MHQIQNTGTLGNHRTSPVSLPKFHPRLGTWSFPQSLMPSSMLLFAGSPRWRVPRTQQRESTLPSVTTSASKSDTSLSDHWAMSPDWVFTKNSSRKLHIPLLGCYSDKWGLKSSNHGRKITHRDSSERGWEGQKEMTEEKDKHPPSVFIRQCVEWHFNKKTTPRASNVHLDKYWSKLRKGRGIHNAVIEYCVLMLVLQMGTCPASVGQAH